MHRSLHFMTWMDGNCLYYTQRVVRWLETWSLTQKWLERLLILGLGILFLCDAYAYVHSGSRSAAWQVGSWAVLLALFWYMHRRPQARRVQELCNLYNSLSRWLVEALSILLGVLVGGWCLATGQGLIALRTFSTMFMIPFLLCVLSLPWDGPQPRRRGKLAKEKVLQLFGTSWLPKPQPIPS